MRETRRGRRARERAGTGRVGSAKTRYENATCATWLRRNRSAAVVGGDDVRVVIGMAGARRARAPRLRGSRRARGRCPTRNQTRLARTSRESVAAVARGRARGCLERHVAPASGEACMRNATAGPKPKSASASGCRRFGAQQGGVRGPRASRARPWRSRRWPPARAAGRASTFTSSRKTSMPSMAPRKRTMRGAVGEALHVVHGKGGDLVAP